MINLNGLTMKRILRKKAIAKCKCIKSEDYVQRVWKTLANGYGEYAGIGSARCSYHQADICAPSKTPEKHSAEELAAIHCMLAGAPTAYYALKNIIELCGAVNFSSHNQMREAVEGALTIAEEALELIKNNNDLSNKRPVDLDVYFGDK